jgi:hypothetical protein
MAQDPHCIRRAEMMKSQGAEHEIPGGLFPRFPGAYIALVESDLWEFSTLPPRNRKGGGVGVDGIDRDGNVPLSAPCD